MPVFRVELQSRSKRSSAARTHAATEQAALTPTTQLGRQLESNVSPQTAGNWNGATVETVVRTTGRLDRPLESMAADSRGANLRSKSQSREGRSKNEVCSAERRLHEADVTWLLSVATVCNTQQEAWLMLTNPRDMFRGQ